MIKKVHIKNFQSHADTELEFHPGVNVIVGSSDSGKSAIFRAVALVMTNRPLGNAYCRWGTKKTEVELTIDQETTIGRVKSKSENNYLFQRRELLAGTEVPEDIRKVLKIDPQINIQQQISAPFLLANSPGEVAAFFNDVAGLSDIDTSIKNLKSWQASHIRIIKQLDLEIEKQQAQVDEMEYLDQVELDLEALENLQIKQTQIFVDIRWLKDLIHKHSRCSEALEQVAEKAQAVPILSKLVQKVGRLDQEKSRIQKLDKLILNYSRTKREMLELEDRAKAVEPLSKISDKIERWENIQEKMRSLQKVWKNWASTDAALRKRQNDVEYYHNQLSDMMPAVCPLCDQEVK